MRIIISLLLCLNISFVIAQSPKVVEKNIQAVNAVHGHMSSTDSIKKAISLLNEAIAIDPSYKLAYGNKAQYLLMLGEKKRALETILQIKEIASGDPFYLLYKGMLLEANGNKVMALEDYKKGTLLFEKNLKENPTEGDFMNYMLGLYLRDNKIYSVDEIEKTKPKVLSPSAKELTNELMNDLYKRKREKAIDRLLFDRED